MDSTPHLSLAEQNGDAGPLVDKAAPKISRIAMIGNFPPRRCGIATFTSDVHRALTDRFPDLAVDIWAMTDRAEGYDYPPAVRSTIAQDDLISYSIAAQDIMASGANLLWIQHEFGIFGGSAGDAILHLLEQITLPVAVTLHTVLKDPDTDQRRVMGILIQRASVLIVMAEQGRKLLIDVYGADPDSIRVIPHGIPDRPFAEPATMKARFGFGDRPVIMTFGLLSPGKGVEAVIDAMPQVVNAVPDALYVVLGATHPNLLASQGEAYRNKLEQSVTDLGISDNVRFINSYIETEELLDYLTAADIYVTPYLNPAQVTSGTLAYAVGLGKAVVSTPYVHAAELLRDGVGCLVDFGDTPGFAAAITTLLGSPARMAELRRRTYALGRTMIWPRLAEASFVAFETMPHWQSAPHKPVMARVAPVGGSGVLRITDATGMLQHSVHAVPDRAHGYCIDDNARALIYAVRSPDLSADERARLTSVYAAFVESAWNDDLKTFRNFMSYNCHWLEERGSDDSVGRTIWALGVTAAESTDPALRDWALCRYERALPTARTIDSIHARAFIMLGAATVLSRNEHAPSREIIEHFGGELAALVHSHCRPDWAWFEIVLAYDNCRLPEALIRGGRAIGSDALIDVGLDTLHWIATKQTASRGFFRPVGHESFGRPFAEPLPFDQQPVEAWATIDACAAAFAETGDAIWRHRALSAWRWFFGDNDLGLPLADPVTGECKDGLRASGVNQNQGAESVLSLQLSAIAIRRMLGDDVSKPKKVDTVRLAAV